jgi:hypothetical protein
MLFYTFIFVDQLGPTHRLLNNWVSVKNTSMMKNLIEQLLSKHCEHSV